MRPQTADEILNSPDYIRCDRYKCRMNRACCQKVWEQGSEVCRGCPNAPTDLEPPRIKRHVLIFGRGRFAGRPPKVSQEGVPAGFKRCNQCGQVKPLSEFYWSPRMRDLRTGECKVCRCAYNRAYLKAHPRKRSPKAKTKTPYKRKTQ